MMSLEEHPLALWVIGVLASAAAWGLFIDPLGHESFAVFSCLIFVCSHLSGHQVGAPLSSLFLSLQSSNFATFVPFAILRRLNHPEGIVTMKPTHLLTPFLLSLCCGSVLAADDDEDNGYTCSEDKLCDIGCCGPLDDTGAGVCGLGPDFCGEGCTSTCDYKSECDPGWGMEWSNATTCPLNVCCSKFGFCGMTESFCGGPLSAVPQCDSAAKSSDKRTIGYYEGWNLERDCGTMEPEDIPLGYLTHINFAFSLINPTTFRVADMGSGVASLYDRVSALKARDLDLQVWIAIGGWAMNDPDQATRYTFSDLAGSVEDQDNFFKSLITFMTDHNFDGIDIDWEYPVADDRSGKPEDFENLVTFLGRLREALNNSGRLFGLTITLVSAEAQTSHQGPRRSEKGTDKLVPSLRVQPASYWYMRHFDIQQIEPIVDWYNMMTYDIHGVWDANVDAIGSNAYAHTNLTEIDLALRLLWRNNINPDRVVLGLGFYGRSFTMEDPSCLSAGCPFSGGAKNGSCTNVSGVLSGKEIRDIIDDGATVTYDAEAGVKIVTWDSDQWVSFDDEDTLGEKVEYANAHCLGGTMIWAIDLDDGTLMDALGGNFGREKKTVYDEFTLADLGSLPDLGSTEQEVVEEL
ncbi:hypothetical protein MKZ38_003180 [Zalerion maritima]|uniref:chitinase n=1 Tax=Zalerion maritima TaxID=339359 RepID=A0AAD5S0F1_9PEZI|nr:hypothetical protein MKZ38_003180 [Zalerion maritima]